MTANQILTLFTIFYASLILLLPSVFWLFVKLLACPCTSRWKWMYCSICGHNSEKHEKTKVSR